MLFGRDKCKTRGYRNIEVKEMEKIPVQTLTKIKLISVQFSRSLCLTLCDPWIVARQDSLSIIDSQSSLRLTSIESVMSSSHLILCCPLLLLPQSLPASKSFPVSQSTLRMRWPKYWSLSFSINPSDEHPGPIFRMNWLDLLAVQQTLKSSPTPQFKSVNSSVLSFLHSPTLTSIHDHWKNHSLD